MCERSIEIKPFVDGALLNVRDEANCVVGCAFITKPNSDGVASLDTINVQKCDRGKGYGGLLMKEIIEIAKLNQAKGISGSLKPEIGCEEHAKAFYIKHGFEIHKDGTLSKRLDS